MSVVGSEKYKRCVAHIHETLFCGHSTVQLQQEGTIVIGIVAHRNYNISNYCPPILFIAQCFYLLPISSFYCPPAALKVTRLERDASSGTALQEISFWMNLEHALSKIHSRRHSSEVQLTLDVLKAGKRFHATVSFDADTGQHRPTPHHTR